MAKVVPKLGAGLLLLTTSFMPAAAQSCADWTAQVSETRKAGDLP